MRIFLAGATGVLGRRILSLLIHDGHDVVALVRASGRRRPLAELGRGSVEVVEGDALDASAVVGAVREAAPDVLMHQLTDLRSGDSASNAALRRRATAHLVDAARQAGVRRVIAQSIAWAYRATDTPADEEVALDVDAPDPARRRTVRAITDLERAVTTAPESVALRYGMLYGPDTWFEPPAAARAADARAGRLVADGSVTSFVHVDDAARAALDALSWPSGPVNVCDDEPAAARTWLPVYCAVIGAPPPPVAPVAASAPGPDASGPDASGRGASNRRARDLGWSPRFSTWRDGFRYGLTSSSLQEPLRPEEGPR